MLTVSGLAGLPAMFVAMIGAYGSINSFGANVVVGVLGIVIVVLSFFGSRGYFEQLRPVDPAIEETREMLREPSRAARKRAPSAHQTVTGLKLASHIYDFPVLQRVAEEKRSEYDDIVESETGLGEQFVAASNWFETTASNLTRDDLDRVWYLQAKQQKS